MSTVEDVQVQVTKLIHSSYPYYALNAFCFPSKLFYSHVSWSSVLVS
jgi:hypothetical protein